MDQKMAYVHPDAKIGKNVTIEPFAMIYGDVEVGDGSWIGPHAVLMDGSRIGQNCKIFPGAVISGIPQDLKYQGEYSTTEIGNNTVIRESVTVNRGTSAKGKTVVGNNSLLMCYVHVAHDSIIKNNVIMGAYSGVAGEVEVDDFAIISPGSLVHQFVRVGTHIIIQGLSKVTKDVPPFITAGRDPLSFAGLNSVGLRRRGFSNEQINIIQDTYRLIYQSNLNTTDAVKEVENSVQQSAERDAVINFIKNSKRGIIRGYGAGADISM